MAGTVHGLMEFFSTVINLFGLAEPGTLTAPRTTHYSLPCTTHARKLNESWDLQACFMITLPRQFTNYRVSSHVSYPQFTIISILIQYHYVLVHTKVAVPTIFLVTTELAFPVAALE